MVSGTYVCPFRQQPSRCPQLARLAMAATRSYCMNILYIYASLLSSFMMVCLSTPPLSNMIRAKPSLTGESNALNTLKFAPFGCIRPQRVFTVIKHCLAHSILKVLNGRPRIFARICPRDASQPPILAAIAGAFCTRLCRVK